MVLLLSAFLAVITFQLTFFMLVSFPLTMINQWLSNNSTSNSIKSTDNLLATKMDITELLACSTSAECGMCTNMTNDGGIIDSPNFPDDYSSDLKCVYNLNGPLEKKIQLSFTEFSLKNKIDSISVFGKAAYPLQIGLTGYVIPQAILSSSNHMIIKFSSNTDNTLHDALNNTSPARWQAKYTFI